MAKAEASVEELVGMIERGELRLPEMQRRYVWRSTRVRDLLDSLYRGYPSGAILLWETDEAVPLQELAISQQSNPYQSTRLLLDGQQRLTSLSAVIRGEPVSVRGRQRPIEILFNLDHPEELAVVTEVNEDQEDDDDLIEDEADSSEDELERRFNKMTFVVATRKLEQLPQWVKVAEVFKTDEDAPFLERAGIEKVNDPRFKKYSQRLAKLRGIRRYTYRMDVLERRLSYDEVTEIFVRVNSLGAKLRSSDLALAQITAKWRNSLKIFQAFQQECAKAGFDLDLGLHLKNLIAFATGQSRFLTVGSLSLEALQQAWKESCEGMRFALNFLKSNAGIDSPALLSSPFLMVTLAYFGHKRDYQLTPEESERLRFWVLVANAKGRYSRGSSETILDQDLAIVKQGAGAPELIERVPRLSSSWRQGLALESFHCARPLGRAASSPVSPYISESDIANLAFIGGKTNRAISDKPPVNYFPALIEKAGPPVFEAQCIPTDVKLLDVPSYKAFLGERRQIVARRINKFLETEV